VRPPAEKGIAVVDLVTGERKTVALPSVPTDLDLVADGKTAFVVLRESGELSFAERTYGEGGRVLSERRESWRAQPAR